MNILMMSNTYKPLLGGLEKSVEILSHELRQRGHQVLIVAPEFPGMQPEAGLVRVPAIQNFNGSDFSLQLPIPGVLHDTLENFRPDLVHTHHPFLIGDTALRVAQAYNVPLIFTHHTLFEHNMHYVPAGRSEVLKRFVTELATGYANLADHVFAPSESIRRMLIERGVHSPVSVVPTGIYTSVYARGAATKTRRDLGIPKDAFVIGCVGRLAPEKNLKFLCAAVAAYMQKNPRACFVIAGQGPSEVPMKDFFAGQGLAPRIFWAGVRRGKALVAFYHAMDVFVFASHSETQGLVLTEAMAAKVPVVAVDAPGVCDILDHQNNGWLVREDSIEDFVQGLSWVASLSAVDIQTVKNACRKKAQQFSVDKCVARALDVYLTLAHQGFSRRPISHDNAWSRSTGLIKAQWNLAVNITKATAAAVIPGQASLTVFDTYPSTV